MGQGLIPRTKLRVTGGSDSRDSSKLSKNPHYGVLPFLSITITRFTFSSNVAFLTSVCLEQSARISLGRTLGPIDVPLLLWLRLGIRLSRRFAFSVEQSSEAQHDCDPWPGGFSSW